jgi:hypothetical protein
VKRLFNDDERYTSIALDLDLEASRVIAPLFKKYIQLGFSIREIEYVIDKTVIDVSCLEIIELGVKKYKAKKEENKKGRAICL